MVSCNFNTTRKVRYFCRAAVTDVTEGKTESGQRGEDANPLIEREDEVMETTGARKRSIDSFCLRRNTTLV